MSPHGLFLSPDTTEATVTEEAPTNPDSNCHQNHLSLTNVRVLIAEVEDTLNKTALQTNQTVVDSAVMDMSRLMEANIDKGALSDGQLTTTSPNLAISARAVDKQNFSGLTLTADAADDDRFQEGEVRIYQHSFVQETSDAISSLVLPASLLTSLDSASRIATTVHIDGKIFKAMAISQAANTSAANEDENYVHAINSYVMSASVVGYEEVTNLTDPVILRFVHLDKVVPLASRPTGDTSGSGGFRSMKRLKNPSKILISLCLALALTDLVFVAGMQNYTFHSPAACKAVVVHVLDVRRSVLHVLIFAGSVDGATLQPVVVHVLDVRRSVLHVLIFAGSVDGATLQPVVVHVLDAVSMVLHFSLLSSMCWMSVEAFYMYMALVRVFRSNITHFMLKASCFGWGVPLVIVAVTVGLNATDNYALLDSGICWLTGAAFYVAFVAPVCLILLFNVISFLLVLRVILGLTNNKLNSTQSTQAVQKLRRAVGVIILLGLTWVFGFLAIDGATQIGLFIFLFYCVFNKDARAACMRCFRYFKSRCRSSEAAYSGGHVRLKTETKDKTFPLKSSAGEIFHSTVPFACTSSSGDASSDSLFIMFIVFSEDGGSGEMMPCLIFPAEKHQDKSKIIVTLERKIRNCVLFSFPLWEYSNNRVSVVSQ
ncbi:hypothetical protein BaRGS_00030062, partial [Batillaria attramentaria]